MQGVSKQKNCPRMSCHRLGSVYLSDKPDQVKPTRKKERKSSNYGNFTRARKNETCLSQKLTSPTLSRISGKYFGTIRPRKLLYDHRAALPFEPFSESGTRELSKNFHLPYEGERGPVHIFPYPRSSDHREPRKNNLFEVELQYGWVGGENFSGLEIKKREYIFFLEKSVGYPQERGKQKKKMVYSRSFNTSYTIL